MRKHKGFTLVELVVVIMILGILAAVAAPKMLNTSAAATDNGLRQTLAVVRDAIERYAAENGGQFPPSTTFKADLEKYLRGKFPACPVGPPGAQNADIDFVTDDPPTGVAVPEKGWKFSTVSGEFICNFNGPVKSEPGINYDNL